MFNLSIRFKLTLLIFSVALITLVITSLVTTVIDIRGFQQAKKAEAQSTINALSTDFVRLLTLGDVDVASDITSHFDAFREIRGFIVYSNDEQPAFRYGQTDISVVDKDRLLDILTSDVIGFDLPVMYKGQRYGHVTINLSTHDLKNDINRQLLITSAIFLITLVMSFALAFALQKRFTDPIVKLSALLDSMSDEGAAEKPAKSLDEIDKLKTGFMQMLETVEEKSNEVLQERNRLDSILESLSDGIITTDHMGRITYMNAAAEIMTCVNNAEARGRRLIEICKLINEDTLLPYNGFLENCLSRGVVTFEYDNISLIKPDGRHVPVQISAAPIFVENKVNGSVITFRNITERREMSRKLTFQAKHDGLTGLINRHEFERRLEDAISSTENDEQHAFLYIDLDQFKVVNDVSGHIAGDALLKQVAHFLTNNVRGSDLVARFGGDEFGILLYDCDTDRAVELANNIITDISQFNFVWDENTFKIGASIGLVSITYNGLTVTDILRDADIACYSAKDLGRNRIHIHEEQDQAVAQRQGELFWISRLNDAISENKFELYLQRIVPVNANSEAQKFEVLLRLQEEEQIITPGAFLPAAERYGLIDYIDRWVIENLLCNKSYKHIIMENPHAQFNINLSGKSIGDERLTPFILDLFKRHDVYPKSICFEITETAAVANFAEAVKFTQSLRSIGCEIALDDFGSGLSSFAYLKNLPVDYLKIDGGFIRDIEHSPINFAMVRSIHELGQIMGIKTVAECVETEEAYAQLRKIGINFVQGFHLHRPAPLTRVAKDDKVIALKHWQR